MAAGRFNFTIEQGTTVDFEIQYQDASGTPIDLAQHQARMMIRPSVDSDSILLTLSSSINPHDGTGLNLYGGGGLPASKPLSSGSIGVFIGHTTSSVLTFNTSNKYTEFGNVNNSFYASTNSACKLVPYTQQSYMELGRNVALTFMDLYKLPGASNQKFRRSSHNRNSNRSSFGGGGFS